MLHTIAEQWREREINILDLNGRVLKQIREPIGIGEQTIAVDVSSFPKGSYFVRIDDGDRKGVRKFLVR